MRTWLAILCLLLVSSAAPALAEAPPEDASDDLSCASADGDSSSCGSLEHDDRQLCIQIHSVNVTICI